MDTPTPPPPAKPTYRDDEFVYVDPQQRVVVGIVEWTKDGLPKPKEFTFAPVEQDVEAPPAKGAKDAPKRKKPFARRYYPWGTYRSMKRIFRLEGKVKDVIDTTNTLESILPKALEQAFWD